MSAITIRLERVDQEQIPEVQSRHAECVSDLAGHDHMGQPEACPAPSAAVAEAHHGLLTLVWARSAVAEILANRAFTVQNGSREGKDRRHVYIVLDEPVGAGPPWKPTTDPRLQQFRLLSWTSKMNCPSWSIPAGAEQIGGTCPGAQGGQTAVPADALRAGGELVERVLSRPVRVDAAICQHCVTGDARVLVAGRGIVRLADLIGEPEFEVWSGKAWRRTHAVFQGVRPVVEIRTNWGQSIRVTDDHKIRTRDGMVEAHDLEPGDRIVFEPPPGRIGADDRVGLTIIARRADAPTAGQARYRTAVTEQFPVTWSHEVGLVLGYVLGDGCVCYPPGGFPSVILSSSLEDRDDVERISDIVARWCDTRAEVHVRTIAPNAFCARPREQAQIAWRVKGLVQYLEDLGLDKRVAPESRRAPDGIWTAGTNAVCGFLSGLFSTDGSVTVNGSGKIEVSLASVSEGLLRDVQLMLFQFGIRSSICSYAASNEKRIGDGYRPLWKLGINAVAHVRAFKNSIGFFNRRKAAKLEEALRGVEQQIGQERYPIVVSVTPMPVYEPVYDLVDVGDEHQFVANGITVSNCYATSGQYSTSNVQFAQLLRGMWVRDAIRRVNPATGRTMFVDTMIAAVAGANFRLEGGRADPDDESGHAVEEDPAAPEPTLADPAKKPPLPPERTGRRFFRIHDSGDFFSRAYLEQWKIVADSLPDVTFWAPTRIWATRWGVEAVNAINREPRNLIIRPSAYHIGEEPPRGLGPGWAAGTVVIPRRANQGMSAEREELVRRAEGQQGIRPDVLAPGGPDPRFSWVCRAYAQAKGSHTCRRAVGLDGATGCRVCWENVDEVINYTLH